MKLSTIFKTWLLFDLFSGGGHTHQTPTYENDESGLFDDGGEDLGGDDSQQVQDVSGSSGQDWGEA